MPEFKEDSSDRGAITRQRMLETAIDVFGVRGFEATSTRMLVSRAGTQLTAISYHFTNKEGLYRAAAEHIAERIGGLLGEAICHAEQCLQSELDHPGLVELGCELLEQFAGHLFGGGIPDSWSRFMSREFAEPTDSFQVLFNSFQPFGRCLCRIIGRIQDAAPEDPEVVLRMLTLVGQVLMFRSDRAASLRFLGWERIGAGELALLHRIIRQNTQAILNTE